MARQIYCVLKPIPSIGAELGDFVVLGTGAEQSFDLLRHLPQDLIRVLSEPGAVELVSACEPLSTASPPHRRGGRGRLLTMMQ